MKTSRLSIKPINNFLKMTDKFYDVQPSGYIQYGNTTTYNWDINTVDAHSGIENSIYKFGDCVFESGFHIGVDPAFEPIDRGKFLGREGYHSGEKYYEDQTWSTGFENDEESNYVHTVVL